MVGLKFHLFNERGLITIAGSDRIAFLQGLVSNDVGKIGGNRSIWAALLTPQGKYRHDFFMAAWPEDRILIDCEGGERMMDLGQTLRRFVLRSDASLDIEREKVTFAVFGDTALRALGLAATAGATAPFADGIAFVDPRLAEVGARVIASPDAAKTALQDLGAVDAPLRDYDQLRIGLGLPDGSRDMQPDKAILLENGFDELGGADWKKGCYMGQELTARTKYRGLVKKRLLPVTYDGAPLETGARITLSGKEVGEIRSATDGIGLALLRLEALEKVKAGEGDLRVGETVLTPRIPDWTSL